jgi:aldose sugar dehydrogenase
MRTKYFGVLVAVVLVAAACGVVGEPSKNPTSLPPDVRPSANPSGLAPGSTEPSTGPAMTDASLSVEVVVNGLTEPTALAFLGPNDFFVTEKSTGQVHHVTEGHVSEPILDLAVNFFDERGLLGIALHPDFAQNGFVYLYWTESAQGESGEGMFGADTDEAKTLPDLGNRVDRFIWDGAKLSWDRNLLKLRSNTLDTDTSGRIRGNHDAGPLVFGKDGKLFVIIGDQNQRSQLQNLPELAAPNDMNLTGVVLRLNDDGSIPQDNPFFTTGAALGGEAGQNAQMIWTYGVRNSFGLAIHPVTGDLWETENGDDSWDEVNIFPAGSNSGWIQLMGPPERLSEFKQIEMDSKDGLDNKDFPPDRLAANADEAQQRMLNLGGSTYVSPVFAWKHPVAVTSIGFVTDDTLGASSSNSAWLGTVLTDSLYRYPLAADGSGFDFAGDPGLTDGVDDNTAKGDVGESAKYVVGAGFGVITAIAHAPDGFLYISSISAGAVYRISPTGTDSASPEPIASVSTSSAP